MTAAAKILIVDDDPRICRTLRSYLKREGYSVSIAANGEEMWQQFTSVAPDLILLDVVLPGDDGISGATSHGARGGAVPGSAGPAGRFRTGARHHVETTRND